MTRKLEDFEGRWRVTREIISAGEVTATADGYAVWTPADYGLRHSEDLTLTLTDGQSFHATRSYLWHQGLQVYFDDGRFFHTIPPEGGRAEHFCAPDHYRVDYDFSGWDFSDWPEWRTHWTVTGPRKSYQMTTVFRR